MTVAPLVAKFEKNVHAAVWFVDVYIRKTREAKHKV